MKTMINLTDSRYDLERFTSAQDLHTFLTGFDGIELMHLDTDFRGIISDDLVIGYHITQPEYWLDFWNGRMDLCAAEFDTPEKAVKYYKGSDPEALVRHFRTEYENACFHQAEYMVIHVSDAGIFEEITGQYHYTDGDVIRGFCEIINEALPQQEDGPLVLLENLWQPGLTFLDPEMTALLLEGVRYPRKGIMLDTGHLMHTNPSLHTQKEAVSYIHQRLDEHGDLCRYIRGIHLNQSITGKVMKRFQAHPPVPASTYEERTAQLFDYIFQIDLHRPFICEGVRELVERIAPLYLTYEFISRDRAEHQNMLRRQQRIYCCH